MRGFRYIKLYGEQGLRRARQPALTLETDRKASLKLHLPMVSIGGLKELYRRPADYDEGFGSDRVGIKWVPLVTESARLPVLYTDTVNLDSLV